MEFNQDTLIIVLIVVASFVFSRMVLPRLFAWGVPFVGAAEVKQRMDSDRNMVVIDVRTPGEFTSDTGHVPGALNLTTTDLTVKLNSLGGELAAYKDAPVCVMCRTHNRSPHAARALKKAGFSNVLIMQGGINAWRSAGLPTEGATS